jgi:predicted Zn-dependent protease
VSSRCCSALIHCDTLVSLGRARAIKPANAYITRFMAYNLHQLGRLAEAAATYEKSLENSGDDVQLLLHYARLLVLAHRLQQAEVILDRYRAATILHR